MSMTCDLTFDANFTLIQLIQRLAQEDLELASALIGADRVLLERILTMTIQEQLTLARTSQPILNFRIDSLNALEAIIAPRRKSRLQGFHGALCMASASAKEGASA